MIIQPDTNVLLDLQEITIQYPNMWILAGVPANEVGKPKQIRKSFVLFAGADEQEFNDFSKKNFEKYYKNDKYQKIFTKFTGVFEEMSIKRVGLFRKID